jgi:hypothetical protein
MKSINLFGMQTVLVNGTPVNTFKIRVSHSDYNESVLAPLHMISKDIRVQPVHSYRNNKVQSLIEISYTGMNWEIDFVVFRTVGKSLKDIQLNKLNERYAWTNDPEEITTC